MGLLVFPRRPVGLPVSGRTLAEPFHRGLVYAVAPCLPTGLTDLITGFPLTAASGAALVAGAGTAGAAAGGGTITATAPAWLKLALPFTIIARASFTAAPAANSEIFAVTYDNAGNSPWEAYALSVDANGYLRMSGNTGGTFAEYGGGVGVVAYRKLAASYVGRPVTLIGLFTASGWSFYIDSDEGIFQGLARSNPIYTATSLLVLGGSTSNVVLEYGLIYNRRLTPNEIALFRSHPYHWLALSRARQWVASAIASANQAPVVDAGADQALTGGDFTATLAGSATDDGLPDPPGALTYSWALVSGPGTATFDDDTDPTTAVTFSGGGSYVLRLTATDGVLTDSDEVTITVEAAATAITQWLLETLQSRAAAGLEVTQWLTEVLDGQPVPAVISQWLIEYLEGRPVAVAVTQWLIEVLAPAPLYFEGPPEAVGEDPCVQRSFEAWLELDL